MDATMNIVIRVTAAQAVAEAKRAEASLRGVSAAALAGGGALGGFGRSLGGTMGNLSKFGKNLQWTGRQLEYNFTLPLLLAGGASVKWANEIETSMVRVRKVYGDLDGLAAEIQAAKPGTNWADAMAASEKQLAAETAALQKSFELLSNRFGVAQKDVIDIAGAWAQAGSAGVALANSTKLTMEAMILGSIDATKATEGLIAVQAIFGLQTIDNTNKTYDLRQALADMNAIENRTSVSMDDLIDVLARAGGTARTAGIDIRHLSAMAASLVPAAGSGAQAGNGLRTMISRIMAPTKEATQLLGMMGINIFETSWQAKNGTERIIGLAEAFNELTQSQKVTVSAAIASRWQINRFDILMQDILSSTGRYQTALDATSESTKSLNTYTRELTTYLSSTPQAFKILTTQIQNSMAKAILPLLPALVAILTRIAQLTESFASLAPETQQMIFAVLGFIAVTGTLGRLVGSSILLFTTLGGAIATVAKALFAIIAPLLSIKVLIAGAVIAAVAALIYVFRDELAPAIVFVQEQFNRLPQGIQDVFIRIVQVVSRAVMAVYEWLSYLNPFARHSPSLVDNVRAGVATILDEYGKLSAITGIIRRATAAHEAFNEATAGGRRGARQAEFSEDRKEIVAFSPGAGDEVDRMIDAILELEDALERMVPLISDQATVVARWAAELRQADLALDAATASLNALEVAASAVADQLSAAQAELSQLANTGIQGLAALEQQIYDNETAQAQLNLQLLKIRQSLPSLEAAEAALDAMRATAKALNAELEHSKSQLDRFTSANITGMGAMSDAIFANEMAQKQLRLEMLRMEEAGQSIDDITRRLAAMQGEIEGLNADKNALRLAGAGSDILGPLQQQIDAVEQARRDLASQGSPFEELQNQLEELQRAGEILDLENSIQFDPLLRQIQQMTDMTEELSFEQIVAGIATWQPRVEELTAAYNAQNLAIDAQEAHLEGLRAQQEAMLAPIEAQIAALEIQRQELELIKRIDFEPLQRQLDELLNPTQEMPFEELKAAILAQIDEVAKLQSQHDEATAAVDRQKAAVDRLQAARDVIAAGYDVEREKLAQLEDAYGGVEGQIRDMESALNDFASAAKSAREAATATGDIPSNAEKLFAAGAGADFEVPGGEFGLGREGGLPEIEDFNKELERQLEEAMGKLGDIDLLEPLRRAWHTAEDWLQDNVGGFFDDLDMGSIGGLDLDFADTLDRIGEIAEDVGGRLEPVGRVFGLIADKVKEFGSMLVEEFGNWGEIGEPLIRVLRDLGVVVSGILQGIVVAVQVAFHALYPVIKPVLEFIVEGVRNALQIIRGVIMALLSLITGDWKSFFSGLLTVADGIWDAIYNIVSNGVELIAAPIHWLVDIVVGAFQWLFDKLVGHSIVPDIVNGIVDLFEFLFKAAKKIWDAIAAAIVWVWEKIIKPVWNAMKAAWDTILKPMLDTMLKIFTEIWNAIGAAIKWVWDNVISTVWDALQWYWENQLKPALGVMLDVFETIWNAIGAAIKFVWEQVIRPIWNALIGFWNTVLSPLLDRMLRGFQNIWTSIGNGLQWVWDNVILKIFQAMGRLYNDYLRAPFDTMVNAFRTVFNGIGDAVKGGINFGISVINALIRGINAVSGLLNLGIKISYIPQMGGSAAAAQIPGNPGSAGAPMAAGGRIPRTDIYRDGVDRALASQGRVGRGFATNRARAIVGEGSPLHPEYVIPTDPHFRSNAERLYGELGAKLGLPGGMGRVMAEGGVMGKRRPGTGGPFDGLTDIAGGLVDLPGKLVGGAIDLGKSAAGQIRKGVVTATFAPFLTMANAAIGQVPFEFVREWMTKLKNDVYNWVKGENDKGHDGFISDMVGGGGDQWRNMWDIVKAAFPNARLFSGFRPGSITATGNKSLHGMGRAIDVTPSMDIFNYLKKKFPSSHEIIYSPAGQGQVYRGKNHWYSEPTRGDHWDHVHWGMAQGGLIPMRAGGIVSSPTAILAGEAGPEAILPLNTFINPLIEKLDAVIVGVRNNTLTNVLNHTDMLRRLDEQAMDDDADNLARHEDFMAWFDANPVVETLESKFAELDSKMYEHTSSITSAIMESASSISSAIGSIQVGGGGGGSGYPGAGEGPYPGDPGYPIPGGPGGSPIPGGPGSSPLDRPSSVTAQAIKAVFDYFNVHYLEGALPGETASDRFIRIASDILQGNRTWESFLGSVQYLTTVDLPIPAYAKGGIARKTPGGFLALLGDGKYDEAVVPLSNEAVNLSGGTTNIFNGDLSFPNIKKGSDAKTFIENLEALGD